MAQRLSAGNDQLVRRVRCPLGGRPLDLALPAYFVPIGIFRSNLPDLACYRPARFFSSTVDKELVIIVPIGMIMKTISSSQDLGKLIRQERRAQGLTQEQLAGLTGVGVRFMRELEAGKDSCQLGRALQVVAALGLSLSLNSRQEIAR